MGILTGFRKAGAKLVASFSDGSTFIVGESNPTDLGLVSSYAPVVRSRILGLGDADYTISNSDKYDTISASTTLTAHRTITLPNAAANIGRTIEIYRNTASGGNFHLYIDGEGAETLSGRTRVSVSGEFGHCKVISDGSIWLIKDFYYKRNHAPSLGGGAQVSAQSTANEFVYAYLDYAKYSIDYTRTIGSINNDSWSQFTYSGLPFTIDSGTGFATRSGLAGASFYNIYRQSVSQFRIGGTTSGTATISCEMITPITWA